MEFILINENKMKVMLSASDLEEFEVETDELDYANTDTKRMFWDILSRAKHSTGFDTDGQRVLVQLYPSRHGGCEMFVTKIGVLGSADNLCESDSGKQPLLSEKITVKPKNEKARVQKKQQCAYAFEKLEPLISVCKHLRALGYKGDSSAYIGENERYYLFLCEPDSKSYYQLDVFSFINEFGILENKDNAKTYLCEHGKPLCRSNAVSLLSEL